MNKNMTKAYFKNNLNALAWYGSYKLWTTREDPEFVIPPYIIAHIGMTTSGLNDHVNPVERTDTEDN